jgi:hypothetical protein
MSRRAHVIVIALAVVVASLVPLHGDGQSARAQVGAGTGPLVSSDATGAVLVAAGLKPGDSRMGEITVTNAGDGAGAFVLSAADRVDTPTAAGPLSAVLDLTVSDLTTGRTVYAGKMAGLGQVALGNLAQGEAHRFHFVVAFPGGRSPAQDNPFQLASTTVSYVWSAGPPIATPGATVAPPASTLGTRPRTFTARLSAAVRQRAKDGRLRVTLVCEAACRATVTASATKGAKARLRTTRRTLRKAGRATLRLKLPARVRAARAKGRRVTVTVRLRATIAGRTVTARKSVRLSTSRRAARAASADAPTTQPATQRRR